MINLFKQNEGFNISTFTGRDIPEDCIEVDNETYEQLLEHKLMWSNGELVENPNYDDYVQEQKVLNQKQAIENRINELKQLLKDSDYRALKYAEGLYTKTEYAPYKELRQSYRDEINHLEEQLNDINNNVMVLSNSRK